MSYEAYFNPSNQPVDFVWNGPVELSKDGDSSLRFTTIGNKNAQITVGDIGCGAITLPIGYTAYIWRGLKNGKIAYSNWIVWNSSKKVELTFHNNPQIFDPNSTESSTEFYYQPLDKTLALFTLPPDDYVTREDEEPSDINWDEPPQIDITGCRFVLMMYNKSSDWWEEVRLETPSKDLLLMTNVTTSSEQGDLLGTVLNGGSPTRIENEKQDFYWEEGQNSLYSRGTHLYIMIQGSYSQSVSGLPLAIQISVPTFNGITTERLPLFSGTAPITHLQSGFYHFQVFSNRLMLIGEHQEENNAAVTWDDWVEPR